MKLRSRDNQRLLEVLYVLLCFGFFFVWSTSKGLSYAPDEYMRYDIPLYIYTYGKLPSGYEVSLRNAIWGFSYAYYPTFLGSLLSAFFMKVVSFFTVEEFALLVAARFTSVLSGTVTVYYILKIAERLFSKEAKWISAVLISTIPQFVFLTSYVNNDILCVCGSALICYAWICGLQDDWNIRNSVTLSIGMIVVALSYYNAYGWILCSAVLFILSFVIREKGQKNYKKMWGLGCFIVALVCAFTAFFFIRNALLYDGDFLGMPTLLEASEKYAMEEYKPSNRNTALNLGIPFYEMLVSGYWTGVPWLVTTWKSFFGVFGYMSVYMSAWIYKMYVLIVVVCVGGMAVQVTQWFRGVRTVLGSRKKMALFYGTLLMVSVITAALSIYYSYAVDYQPQGRYCYPMIIALFVFLGTGIDWLIGKVRSLPVRRGIAAGSSALLIALVVSVFFFTYL